MAHQTDATVVVPIYPLAPEGTAGTVEPELASLISSEIAANGASHVSVLGDSAGGGMALSAVELLVKDGDPVPHSMVLDSPTLDLTMTNPNIAFINDPVLSLADGHQDSLLWAGDLPLTDPLVSPLYGSLAGLPPTFVYSGSNEILAPDVLVLEQDAIANDAPFSFILRSGELHDWALFPFADGGQVQPQIYQELGLTGASASAAATGNADGLDALQTGLQNLATDFASTFSSGLNLTDLSTDVTNLASTISTDLTTLASDWSAIVTDAVTSF
jgi:triacylglycerol lipase